VLFSSFTFVSYLLAYVFTPTRLSPFTGQYFGAHQVGSGPVPAGFRSVTWQRAYWLTSCVAANGSESARGSVAAVYHVTACHNRPQTEFQQFEQFNSLPYLLFLTGQRIGGTKEMQYIIQPSAGPHNNHYLRHIDTVVTLPSHTRDQVPTVDDRARKFVHPILTNFFCWTQIRLALRITFYITASCKDRFFIYYWGEENRIYACDCGIW